ncbi:hypothetical protein FZI91_13465 [Mycobacterium sp. CBMA271]|nr:hypothetical protein [Mycobacteroides sp. CBMA 271]
MAVVAAGPGELAVGMARPTAATVSKPSMAAPDILVRELTVVLSIYLNVTNANSVDVLGNG